MLISEDDMGETVKLIGKRIAALAAVAALCIAMAKGLDYLYFDDTSTYTRVMIHELQKSENVDVLMLGASLIYTGVDPYLIEENTGKTAFDASSSAQPVDGSVALLKEALKHHKIKEVYFDITHSEAMMGVPHNQRNDLFSVYLVSDFLPRGWNRTSYLLQASSPEYYLNGFFPAKRSMKRLLDFDYIGNLLAKKGTAAYRNYGYDYITHETQRYAGKGYVPSTEAAETHMFYTSDGSKPFIRDTVTEEWKSEIQEMIQICRDNDIKLVMISLPVTDVQLCAEGNWDEAVSFIREFLEPYDVDYVDFNLLDRNYFPKADSWYKDGHHLNETGAEKFTAMFTDYMNGTMPDGVFRNSVTEILDQLPPEYYGICYKDEGTERNMRLIANHPELFEYRIEVQPDGKEKELIQDFSPNTEFSLSLYEAGEITVTYRIAGGEPVSVVRRYGYE